jgi:hypothetical protein
MHPMKSFGEHLVNTFIRVAMCKDSHGVTRRKYIAFMYSSSLLFSGKFRITFGNVDHRLHL